MELFQVAFYEYTHLSVWCFSAASRWITAMFSCWDCRLKYWISLLLGYLSEMWSFPRCTHIHTYIYCTYRESIILSFDRSQKLIQHFKVVAAWRVVCTIFQILKWLYKYTDSRICAWKIKLIIEFIKLCFSVRRYECHFWELFQRDCQCAWIWMFVGKQKLLLLSYSHIYIQISWFLCWFGQSMGPASAKGPPLPTAS